MSYERVIEYLEMIKEEYPGGKVCEACDRAIELIKKEIRKCSGDLSLLFTIYSYIILS